MMSTIRAFAAHVIALSIVLVASSSQLTFAQQVGFVDLSPMAPQPNLRYPQAKEGQPSGLHGGMHEYRPCRSEMKDGALKTTLLSLDRTDYNVGDHPVFEVQIENVGTTSIRVPSSATLSDVQPADAAQKFAYSTLQLVLWIGGANWKANTGGGTALYGNDSRPGTMLTLRPGEWLRIVARGNLALPEDFAQLTRSGDVVSQANAHVLIYNNETLLTATAGATTSDALCLTETNGPSVRIEVKPK
jgi:hypothetical protein